MHQAASEPTITHASSKDPMLDLPFIRPSDGRSAHNFWAVTPTGDFAADCDRGAEFARMAVRYCEFYEFPPLLVWIVEAMIARGEFGPLEIGFMSVVATVAVGGQE